MQSLVILMLRLKTYEDTEKEMGSGNAFAVKVYSEHFNYLYTTYESKQQDPGKWTDKQKEDILAIYMKEIK